MNLLRDLFQVKVEVSDRIMKQFTDRHEIMEIGVPPAGIMHPAFPFFVLDSRKLIHKREINPVIDSANSLMRKYSGCSRAPRALIQLNGVLSSVSIKPHLLFVAAKVHDHDSSRFRFQLRLYKFFRRIFFRLSP